MPLEFTLDLDKAREALVYLASHSTGFDIYKACKLLFLSDKYHLVRFGRPITGDWYFAMPHGPAPNRIYGQLDMVIQNPNSMPYLSSVLTVNRAFQNPRFVATQQLDLDNLSKSDIDALDETLRRYDLKTFDELWILTHGMLAYRKAWKKHGKKKSYRMAFEDFFEDDSDAIAGALDEAVENSELRRAFPVR